MNVVCGVCSSRNAPTRLPKNVITMSGANDRSCFQLSALRYAPVEASVPGHSAMVLVALAFTGGMPVKSRAGNAINPPPPATELTAPPATAAENRRTISEELTFQCKHKEKHSAFQPSAFSRGILSSESKASRESTRIATNAREFISKDIKN